MFKKITETLGNREKHSDQFARLQKVREVAAPQAKRDIITRGAQAQAHTSQETLWNRNQPDAKRRMEEIARRTGYSIPSLVPEPVAQHGMIATNNFKTWLGAVGAR